MLSPERIEASRLENGEFSAEIQTAIRAELEMMLRAPFFAQSNRCKNFLTYVVEQTLSSNAGELKERTIGISVFGRETDYDTGEHSIVRVTANEVRKRIGQYYREATGTHPIQIELPRGSYVPEFRIHATRRSNKVAETAPESVDRNPEPKLASPRFEPVIPPVPEGVAEPVSAPMKSSSFARRSQRQVLYLAVVTLLVLAGAAFGLLRQRSLNAVPDLWGSFLHTNSPVLMCIDTHQLPLPGSASTEGSQKFADMVLRKQIIALDDAAVLASMAAMLGKKDIPFRVVGAEQTSLADLRRQPVILIGAIDNKWTIRLTQNLRYQIEVANAPGSGAEKEPVASIVDSQHPGAAWTTDLSIPFKDWKSDYAVIARMDDATTGVPVLIEAGLGNDGTLAANELIASGGLSPILANERSCRGKKNFEAVIETQIIDTKSGPPHVLRLTCW